MIQRGVERAFDLAAKVPEALVLRGDATDPEVLREAGVQEADYFVAATQQDEANLLSSLLAREAGAKAVVSLYHQPEFRNLMQAVRIDIPLSPRMMIAGTILRMVHRREIVSLDLVEGGNAEVVEFQVPPRARVDRHHGRAPAQLEAVQKLSDGGRANPDAVDGQNDGRTYVGRQYAQRRSQRVDRLGVRPVRHDDDIGNGARRGHRRVRPFVHDDRHASTASFAQHAHGALQKRLRAHGEQRLRMAHPYRSAGGQHDAVRQIRPGTHGAPTRSERRGSVGRRVGSESLRQTSKGR